MLLLALLEELLKLTFELEMEVMLLVIHTAAVKVNIKSELFLCCLRLFHLFEA